MNKVQSIVGIVLHSLVALVMIMAGSGKAFGFAPAEIITKMGEYGLSTKVGLIGWGELISAILLIVPFTTSLGTLLVSGFWGGVICIHMAHGEDILFPSAFLVVTWLGTYFREPGMFSSFSRIRGRSTSPVAVPSFDA